MSHLAYENVVKWDIEGATSTCGKSFNAIYATLEFLDKTLYHQYVPCLGTQHSDFLTRLRKWIDHVPDDKQKMILIELAQELIFLGRDEFLKLHQAALAGPITRWLIDSLDLRIDDPDLDTIIQDELHEHTWYCPITDSMQISDFHHINHIGGADHRPDFRSLHEFGDAGNVLSYMANHENANRQPAPLRRIVLLEDFVGSGTQLGAAKFAAELSPDVQVLLVPLIICPAGDEVATRLANTYTNLRYEPLMRLSEDLFINDTQCIENKALCDAVRDLLYCTYALVVGDGAHAPRPYGRYGFADTGALLVMYSNTPANTLPVVHHKSSTWAALFPRSARIR